MKQLSNEKGSTIIEYVLILPVILFIVTLLVVMMFITFEKAVLDSATARGALYAKKIVVDPQYAHFTANTNDDFNFVGVNNISGFVTSSNFNDISPYRYLDYAKSKAEAATRVRVEKLIGDMSFLTQIEDDNLKITPKINLFGIEVIAVRTFKLPIDFMGFEFGDVELVSRNVYTINDPDEFIRLMDMAREVSENTGFDKKIAEMFKKVNDLKEKFFSD